MTDEERFFKAVNWVALSSAAWNKGKDGGKATAGDHAYVMTVLAEVVKSWRALGEESSRDDG